MTSSSGMLRRSDFECGLCGEVFNSLKLFDAHQITQYGQQPPVICRDPAAMAADRWGNSPKVPREGNPLVQRLVQDARGVWMTPAALRTRQRRTAQLARRPPE